MERTDIYIKCLAKSYFNFIPSDVLKIKKYSGNKLNLTSASSPIVVKKQRKI